jgi:hypothetical protein
MVRRAVLVLCLPIVLVAAAHADDLLPAAGTKALENEYRSRLNVIAPLLNGDVALEAGNKDQEQALDFAAQWSTYRLTWGLEREPGKINGIFNELEQTLSNLKAGKEKSGPAAELYTRYVIAHAVEVLKTKPAVARINAARVLARLAEKGNKEEKTEDVLVRMSPAAQNDLADVLATIIKSDEKDGDEKKDGERYYAFRALRAVLALPQPNPPGLLRAKEEAAVAAVVAFLKDRNKPFPAEATREEFEGFRILRREAIRALAQGHYPTLAMGDGKIHPPFILLKIAARDGLAEEPRLDERIEAAIGVARTTEDKDFQPDYAARQLGLVVVDFLGEYARAKQLAKETQPQVPWMLYAARLIEALEAMKAQHAKDAQVGKAVDICLKALAKVETGGVSTNPAVVEADLDAVEWKGKRLFNSDEGTTIKPADRTDADAPPAKPEEKKEPGKPEEKKDKSPEKKDK